MQRDTHIKNVKAMYTANKRCTAHVTLNRGRVKEYGGRNVYLKSKQEFEIELFNPHTKSVLAKIYLNGIALSGGGLVIRPGQRVYLERYLDENRKFKFDTYEVENSREAAEAIAKNGDLRVEFFYEQDPPTWKYRQNYDDYYKQSLLRGGPGAGGWGGSSIGTGNADIWCSGSISTSNFLCNVSSSYTTDFNLSSTPASPQLQSKSLETGRVEKGDYSAQSLQTVYEDFNSWYSESETIKILPFSLKPQEISELRNYCTSCKTRIKKSSWKFCPTCGECLD